MSESVNPWAAPQAEVRDMSVKIGNLELAGRGRRLAGWLIDSMAGALCTAAIVWLMPAEWREMPPYFDTLEAPLVAVVAFLAIQSVLLIKRGQTLGKFILGMRIVHPDGARVNALRLIGVRPILPVFIPEFFPTVGIFFILIDALGIFGRQRRCLHDLLANTMVIRLR